MPDKKSKKELDDLLEMQADFEDSVIVEELDTVPAEIFADFIESAKSQKNHETMLDFDFGVRTPNLDNINIRD